MPMPNVRPPHTILATPGSRRGKEARFIVWLQGLGIIPFAIAAVWLAVLF